MRTLLAIVLIVGWISAHRGLAQQREIPDLKALSAEHQVEAVTYCKGIYKVTLRDGSTRHFPEFSLRMKTDGGPNGPRPGNPALIPANMMGDRAFLIFFKPGEISSFIVERC